MENAGSKLVGQNPTTEIADHISDTTNTTYGYPDITIGISGCSSSGKTTLAYILEKILRTVFRSTSGPTRPLSSSILQQDRYFNEEDDCPIVQILPWRESSRIPANTADSKVVFGKRWATKQGHVDTYDKDCIQAVDFPLLEQHMDDILASKSSAYTDPSTTVQPSSATARSVDGGIDARMRTEQQRALDMLDQDTFAGAVRLLEARLDKCDERYGKTYGAILSKTRFTIVEGFLLFAIPEAGEVESAEPHAADIVAAQRRVFEKLQIQLFLPTEEATARRRRFQRPDYIDAAFGGSRRHGELWKTRGYFHDCAWPNYDKYHRHLLGPMGGDVPPLVAHDVPLQPWLRSRSVGDVDLRPPGAEDINETVMWATRMVSEGLARFAESLGRPERSAESLPRE